MNDLESKLVEEYDELKPTLQQWGNYVDSEIVSILNCFESDNLIKIYPSHRVKDRISYLSKAYYRKKEYNDPIIDIEDKVGTRIVLLKSEDVEKAAKLLVDSVSWNAKITKTLQGAIDNQPRIFDYQSMHIVVTPTEQSRYDKELIPKLSCEIQIRTLLQHAFAEISHDSTYKGPFKNDKDIIRHLAKSMALMEATDDYFCQIFSMMTDQSRYYSNYMQRLIGMYKEMDSNFDSRSIDMEISEIFLELLESEPADINDVEMFFEKEKKTLKIIFQSKNGIFFQQPIGILISYYQVNHKFSLKEKWPLSKETLKSVYQSFGESFDQY